MPSITPSSLIRHLVTSVFNLLFTRRKRGLPSRCAFVFLYEVTLSTEEEEEKEEEEDLLGCPKLANRAQPLVGRSSACCEDLWGRY